MIRKKRRVKGKVFESVVLVKGSPVSKTFASYKEAERWQNHVRSLRDQDKPVVSHPVTVEMMFKAYLEHAQEKGRSAGTIKTAESRFSQHVLPGYGSHLDMTTVSYEEHQTFLTMLMKKGVGPATRNRIRTLVRTLYSLAIKSRLWDGVFKVNPFDSIDPTEEPKKAISYWNQGQIEQFLEANRKSHHYPLFVLLFRTGLRIGEALGIHGEQIDTMAQLLTVDRQFDSASNKVERRTKGRRIRRVFLIDEVMRCLSPILRDGLLFTNENGSPLIPDHFRKAILPEACNRAGLKVINPHATRHSFSSAYLMNGGDLWDLSKILGHSSTAITEQRYGHFDLAHVRRRMEVIERKENVIRANFG